VSLATGSRVCVLLGLLLLVVAAYFYWVPIGAAPLRDGFPARCGSAADPPSEALGRAVCGVANDVQRSRALTALGGAVVLIVVGPLLFGLRRSDDHASAAG
jgi:hypothetical protein